MLHSSTDQQLFEKYLYNQSSYYKSTDVFCYERKLSHTTAETTLSAVSNDEWDTKEVTGKSTV